MNFGSTFRFPGPGFVVLGFCAVLAAKALTAETPKTPVVYSAEVDSIIHPVSADFMIQTMARADAEGAVLVLFTLRTPGGLVDSTREIITRMINAGRRSSSTSPSGARAASAGFLLTIAADVAAMAPGTHIGAAHPVSAAARRWTRRCHEGREAAMSVYARLQRGRTRSLLSSSFRAAFTEEEAPGRTAAHRRIARTRRSGSEDRRPDNHAGSTAARSRSARPMTIARRDDAAAAGEAQSHPNIAYSADAGHS
jgi:membrane-bound ClpP family serine protease